MRPIRTLTLIAALVSAHLASAQYGIVTFPRADAPAGISFHGDVIFGNGPTGPFRWTKATGVQPLDMQSTWTGLQINAVASNGEVVVGEGTDPSNHISPFMFGAGHGFLGLNTFPAGSKNPGGAATCCDFDGYIIGGNSKDALQNGQPARWVGTVLDPQLGPANGFDNGFVTAMNGDGTVVFGNGYTSGHPELFRWRANGGAGLEHLGYPSGTLFGIFDGGQADYLGDVLVGSLSNTSGQPEAFRWTEANGFDLLGYVPGIAKSSLAYGVSADGNVVVGRAAGGVAWMWNKALGMVDFRKYLLSKGLTSLGNWQLLSADFISGDGTTIVGQAIDDKGTPLEYVITVPYLVVIAKPDSYATLANRQLAPVASKGVLANDINASGGTAVLGTGVSHGTLTLFSTGSFSYTPNTGFVGTDQFTYKVTKNGVDSNYALVTISVRTILSRIGLVKSTIVGGNDGAAAVTISPSAPSGGIAVTVGSNNSALVHVYGTQVVDAGQTVKSFTFHTSPVSASTSVIMHAVYLGQSKVVTLTLIPASLLKLELPASAKGGTSVTFKIDLDGGAPTGGASVTLSSSNSGLIAVASPQVIGVGKKTLQLTLATKAVTANTPVTITGTYLGVTKTATVTLTP